MPILQWPPTMRAETICIHGDGEHAVEFAETIAQELKKNDILITPKRTA